MNLTEFAHIKPVCLPSAGAEFTGEATVSGWGKMETDGDMTSWWNIVTYDMNSPLCAGSMMLM